MYTTLIRIKNTILLIEVQNKLSIFYFHTYTM